VDEIVLDPGKTRTAKATYLSRTALTETKVPLAQQLQGTLRNSALGGYRPMVIIADDREATLSFIDDNYLDYDENKDVYPFMQLVVTSGKTPLDPADAAFLKERSWPLPEVDRIVAIVTDLTGKEVARQKIDFSDKTAPEQAAHFIHQHAPPPDDAEKKWSAAFAEARRSNTRVWARVSQRYCGPCFEFARWLDDQRALLAKDYILLKIDNVRDLNGENVAERISHGKEMSIPFHAIFDASGKMLIDSTGPLGNIGNASRSEGKKHLRKMLLDTHKRLTEVDIDSILESSGSGPTQQ
jgi:hypothetical protein